MTVYEFRCAVFVYCVLTRASETQGFRTKAHNDLVGGVEHSPHLYGLGQDVVYDGPVGMADRPDVAERLGLKLVREADHDHLQPADWRAG